jgi:hypothetical protein
MKTTARIALMLMLTAVLLASCSTRQWYEGSQARLREDCRQLPSQSEYQRCMDAAHLRYEDYQRRREGKDTPDTTQR